MLFQVKNRHLAYQSQVSAERRQKELLNELAKLHENEVAPRKAKRTQRRIAMPIQLFIINEGLTILLWDGFINMDAQVRWIDLDHPIVEEE